MFCAIFFQIDKNLTFRYAERRHNDILWKDRMISVNNTPDIFFEIKTKTLSLYNFTVYLKNTTNISFENV